MTVDHSYPMFYLPIDPKDVVEGSLIKFLLESDALLASEFCLECPIVDKESCYTMS